MNVANAGMREDYDREGIKIVRSVIDSDLALEGLAHIQWLLKKNSGLRPEQLGNNLMSNDAFWVRLVGDDRLLDVAEQFIGPDIALFASHYIAKAPFDGQAVLWHQDGSYWPLEPMDVTTLWLCLDESTAENGCMRVIPRSHHTQLQQMKERRDVANVLNSGIDDAFVDESEAIDIVLGAGDVSIHHPNIIHGSKVNASAKWRSGLTIRYIPTTTRIMRDGQWPSAFLLRGQAVAGINTYVPRPGWTEEKSMPFRGHGDFR